MAQTEKCAHRNCTCPAEPDSEYCSTMCEDSRDTTEIFCECGHDDCKGVAHSAAEESAARRIA